MAKPVKKKLAKKAVKKNDPAKKAAKKIVKQPDSVEPKVNPIEELRNRMKGNKYAIGNDGGRPAHFETPEDLAAAVNEYFEYIKGDFHEVTHVIEDIKTGKKQTIKERVCDRSPEPSTITGLVLYLGFAHRQSLDDYQRRPEFSDIIKRARSRVEHGYELRLAEERPTGAIFALKNMGWTEKFETKNENTNYNSRQLTADEIKEIGKALEDEC